MLETRYYYRINKFCHCYISIQVVVCYNCILYVYKNYASHRKFQLLISMTLYIFFKTKRKSLIYNNLIRILSTMNCLINDDFLTSTELYKTKNYRCNSFTQSTCIFLIWEKFDITSVAKILFLEKYNYVFIIASTYIIILI